MVLILKIFKKKLTPLFYIDLIIDSLTNMNNYVILSREMDFEKWKCNFLFMKINFINYFRIFFINNNVIKLIFKFLFIQIFIYT